MKTEIRFRAVLNSGKTFPKSYTTVKKVIAAIKAEGMSVSDIRKIEEFNFNDFKGRGRGARKY